MIHDFQKGYDNCEERIADTVRGLGLTVADAETPLNTLVRRIQALEAELKRVSADERRLNMVVGLLEKEAQTARDAASRATTLAAQALGRG